MRCGLQLRPLCLLYWKACLFNNLYKTIVGKAPERTALKHTSLARHFQTTMNAMQEGRVSLADLQQVYFDAQQHYTRPAFAVLSDAQARYYVAPLQQCAFATELPDMFRVLTTRTTAPEYFDLLAHSLRERRMVDGDAATSAEVRVAQQEVTAQMLAAIHEAEQARLQRLRECARARRQQNEKNKNVNKNKNKKK